MSKMRVLATDMDGTFIPLAGNQQNRRDLIELTALILQHEIELVYVTGRHYELMFEAISSEHLPSPDWMICDVGSSIYHRHTDGEISLMRTYEDHLASLTGDCDVGALQNRLAPIVGLQLQAPEKQGRFKLSYYCDAAALDSCSEAMLGLIAEDDLPYHAISSVDPFTGTGLIDLMPKEVNKAYALRWWADHNDMPHDEIMFAGDSGNDLAALTEGYRSIVVGNASQTLKDQVQTRHREAGWQDRLFDAERVATSGLLDGVKFFAEI